MPISQIFMVCLLCARRYYWRYKNHNYTPGPIPRDDKTYIHLTNTQQIFTVQSVLIQKVCTAEKEWLMQCTYHS